MKVQSQGTNTQFDYQFTEEDLNNKLSVEGECKITSFTFLTFSMGKTCIILPFMIISVIGALLLKHSQQLRRKVFYDEAEQASATHVYVVGSSKHQEEIILLQKHQDKICFHYKQLRYELIGPKPYPVCIHYQHTLMNSLNQNFLRKGLKQEQVKARLVRYGKNEHIVNAPNYFLYLYEVMTQPFFFIQYLAAVVYIVQKLSQLAIILIGASLITTTINYILLYCSYRKIKEIAQIIVDVQTIRNHQKVIVKSNQLVPGDIIVPQNELYCDVLLLKGQVYVNQANLTGQSIPIRKFGVQNYKNYKTNDSSIWIFEGSKILSSEKALAMVVHTGYTSKKGRILRKMLHRQVSQPNMFKSYIYFLIENFIVTLIVYLATLHMRIKNDNLDTIIIILNFLLIVTFCFPPACPIYFNLIYSFALVRMKFQGILGTYPQKTIESAHLKVMCFDKTGTLTQDKVKVQKILKFHQDHYSQIDLQQNSNQLDFKLFATCHTVKQFNDELMGDEIDLKTFLASGYKLSQKSQPNICTIFQSKDASNHFKLKILKIFPYESKFQSMSVLIFDQQTNRHFIFTKGAPEVIYKHSSNRFHYFEKLMQRQSYSGFRTIGYAYREISEERIKECLNQSRENFLKNVKFMGILVFQNKLKEDAFQTISLLREANIQSKMITGDNIYIAIQTAIRCGILNRQEQLKVIQGSSQKISSTLKLEYIRFNIKSFKFSANGDLQIQQSKMYYNEYCNLTSSIIVDNNFLKLRDDIQFNLNIKVFARISPENKAKIVSNFKKQFASKRTEMSKWQKMKSEEIEKVGMVGDGANDLLAIKESDIGVGISNCDSSYASCFSINKLKDLDYIVREAKSSEMEIIQICRIICINGFVGFVTLVIMETQASFFSFFQIIFNNLTKSLIFPILLGLSGPSDKQTKQIPSANFLMKENQLVHWGNAIFSSMAMICTLLYMRTIDGYVYNTSRGTVNSGWVSATQLVSSQYLYSSLQPVVQILCVYQGSPWKEPIYKNRPLFIVVLLNLIFQIGLFFIHSQPIIRDFFGFVQISTDALLSLFYIAGTVSIVLVIWTIIIHKICSPDTQYLSKHITFSHMELADQVMQSERQTINKK